MAIPDFQSIMPPLLRFCEDGKEHSNQDVLDVLASQFQLSDSERKQLLPSGQQRLLDNRVAWARAHMKMALLIENPRRGIFRITERSKSILAQSPSAINLKFLRQYPEYVNNREKPHGEAASYSEPEIQTPEEQIEQAYEALRVTLTREILLQLKSHRHLFSRRLSWMCWFEWVTVVHSRTPGKLLVIVVMKESMGS
jgi:restriction system protein